jgi:hypothetical protein
MGVVDYEMTFISLSTAYSILFGSLLVIAIKKENAGIVRP